MSSRQPPFAASRFTTRFGRALSLLLVGVTLCGCQALRERSARRSEQCGQLCAEATAAKKEGADDLAHRLLDLATRKAGNEDNNRVQLAETCWELGRKEEALNHWVQAIAEHPTDAQLCARYATALWESGRTSESDRWARSALSIDPTQQDALMVCARAAMVRGDYGQALARFHELLQLSPDHVQAQLGLAQVQLARGEPDLAAPILRNILGHPWTSLEVRQAAQWSLGEAYAASNRWSDAVEVWETSIAGRQPSAADWYRLAEAQSRSGQSDAAVACVARALQLDGSHGPSRELAGRLAENGPRFIQPAAYTGQP